MTAISPRLRPTAAIIRDGAILLIQDDDPDSIGLHTNLPGGGLEPGEALHDGLRREMRISAA